MKKIFLIAMAGMMMACGNKVSNNNATVGADSASIAQSDGEAVSSEPSIRETCNFSTKFRKDGEGQRRRSSLASSTGRRTRSIWAILAKSRRWI